MRSRTSDYGYAHLYTRAELNRSFLAAGLKPVMFTSEYNALLSLPSRLPKPALYILSFFLRFGERIGFSAIKTVKAK
jgi:hypothetical protein